MVVYAIYLEPFYDNINMEYKHVVTINNIPLGPLKDYIIKTVAPKLSIFKSFNSKHQNTCIYIIKNIDNTNTKLLDIENIDILINFLTVNNYTINNEITKLMNKNKINTNNGKKLLFYIEYNV